MEDWIWDLGFGGLDLGYCERDMGDWIMGFMSEAKGFKNA